MKKPADNEYYTRKEAIFLLCGGLFIGVLGIFFVSFTMYGSYKGFNIQGGK